MVARLGAPARILRDELGRELVGIVDHLRVEHRQVRAHGVDYAVREVGRVVERTGARIPAEERRAELDQRAVHAHFALVDDALARGAVVARELLGFEAADAILALDRDEESVALVAHGLREQRGPGGLVVRRGRGEQRRDLLLEGRAFGLVGFAGCGAGEARVQGGDRTIALHEDGRGVGLDLAQHREGLGALALAGRAAEQHAELRAVAFGHAARLQRVALEIAGVLEAQLGDREALRAVLRVELGEQLHLVVAIRAPRAADRDQHRLPVEERLGQRALRAVEVGVGELCEREALRGELLREAAALDGGHERRRLPGALARTHAADAGEARVVQAVEEEGEEAVELREAQALAVVGAAEVAQITGGSQHRRRHATTVQRLRDERSRLDGVADLDHDLRARDRRARCRDRRKARCIARLRLELECRPLLLAAALLPLAAHRLAVVRDLGGDARVVVGEGELQIGAVPDHLGHRDLLLAVLDLGRERAALQRENEVEGHFGVHRPERRAPVAERRISGEEQGEETGVQHVTEATRRSARALISVLDGSLCAARIRLGRGAGGGFPPLHQAARARARPVWLGAEPARRSRRGLDRRAGADRRGDARLAAPRAAERARQRACQAR